MHFTSLRIENFRGVRSFSVEGLDQTVVVAGPNGCGKTSLLDAIRLLKSAYGGYRRSNEFQQWFGEFQIDLKDPSSVARVLRDRDHPMVIEATMVLTDSERTYLRGHLGRVLEERVWAETTQGRGIEGIPLAERVARQPAILARVEELAPALLEQVDAAELHLSLAIPPDGKATLDDNPLVALLFATFDPENLGVIDFYSAQRQYQREQIGGINLNIEEEGDKRAQHLLYGSQAKYQNVKSHLAASYISDLIAEAAGVERSVSSLNATLSELFDLFFDGKSFDGVEPTPSGKPSLSRPSKRRDHSRHRRLELR